MEKSKILVLNMGSFMKPLIELLRVESGCEVIIADSVEDAVQKLNAHRIKGAIIAFHPEVNPDSSMGISSGLEMWRRVLRGGNEDAATIPIIVIVESGFFNTTIEMQIKRYGIRNNYCILAGKEYNNDSLTLVKKHFGLQ
jgi:hypothetical protein